MKRFIKKILGITALEERVKALEEGKSQTPMNTDDTPLYGNVMDEWMNGKEGGAEDE